MSTDTDRLMRAATLFEYLTDRFSQTDIDEMCRGLGLIQTDRSWRCFEELYVAILDKIRAGKVLP